MEKILNNVKKTMSNLLQNLGMLVVAFPDVVANIIKKRREIDIKKRLISLSMVLIFFISGSNDFRVMFSDVFSKPVFVVTVNGQEIGKVLISDDVVSNESFNKAVVDKLTTLEGVQAVQINDTIELTEGKASKDEISDFADVEKKVVENLDFKVMAYDLLVDNNHVAYLANDKEINDYIENIKEPFLNENIDSISLVEELEINETFINKSEIENFNNVEEILSGNKVEELKHKIVEGDTLWDLAIDNEVTLEDLYYSNPGLDEDTLLQLDSEITIITPVPFISVRTLEKVTYEAVAERTVKYVNNDEEYKTYKQVINEGSDGEKIVTANIVKTNGLETDRLIIEEVITVPPVEEVIEIGTMNLPPKKAIGTFIMPTTGRISDRFGTRSYGHKGIDIANSAGTRINASDGGLVTFSGWMGNYGYLIIIDHQNGYETYYGHNSQNLVSVGEMVAQGQQIAKMGTTGRSTGNHSHFEVRVNGVPKNPFDYVQY